MDILKKIITSNDKRIILLQPDSRNNNSLSMKEYTSRSNNIIVINIYRYTAEKKQQYQLKIICFKCR